MEAFSLLKYWRGGGGVGGVVGDHVGVSSAASNTSKPITATLVPDADDEENDDEQEEEEEENDDDGPFFDLEFSVNDEEDEENDEDEEGRNDETQKGEEEDDEEEEDEVEEREFKFTLSSASSSNDRTDISTDQNLSLSPSDDLFFKGKLVPVDSTATFASDIFQSSSNNSKPVVQFPVSLMKSATKFRVFMLGLNKKSKTNNSTNSATDEKLSAIKEKQPRQEGKFFTVKFNVEEVPIVSLFTRDNSSRVSKSSSKQNSDNDSSSSSSSSSSTSSATTEEKRFAKEVMQRYLKMVKPLYVRVSRKYGEKLRLSGQVSLTGAISKPSPPAPAPDRTAEKSSEPEVVVSEALASNSNNGKSLRAQVNLPAGLRVVCKHLGKSRSASAAAAAVAAPPPPPGTASSSRRDDSLLQQQDGIQSAILHCKRSFNSIRDSEASLLSRSASDPSRKSSEVAEV